MNEPASAETTRKEKTVQAAVDTFARAFLEADVVTLETLLTQEYVHVNGRSGTVLNRNEWLHWMKSRQSELENKDLMISEYRLEDLVIRVYENVAIVTGQAYTKGTQKGETFTSHVRFTNTWILWDGVWQRAAFHDSPFPEPRN